MNKQLIDQWFWHQLKTYHLVRVLWPEIVDFLVMLLILVNVIDHSSIRHGSFITYLANDITYERNLLPLNYGMKEILRHFSIL